MLLYSCVVSVFTIFAVHAQGAPRSLQEGAPCEVRARLEAGWVCGVKRVADNRTIFASFLGVAYASQPVDERRFSELEPVVPWDEFYDASAEGPICPQHDVFYGPLQDSTNMSEACIYANIHVPIDALPGYNILRPARHLQPPYEAGLADGEVEEDPGLPILVFIHGGGFAFGSGGTGLHGPEYLMHRDVIVITFNYRLNVFGFLSLNSTSIPGNNGLRDAVTLLKWVQANARSFGGDPSDVTLAGQSAGASMVHLLTLSTAAEGLFRRAILMSGTGIRSFHTTSPVYAEIVANLFLSNLGLNATDPEDIHQQLVKMPLQDIMEANKLVQDTLGIIAFLPVVESPFPGFTTILDNDPEILVSKGYGKDIPLIIGSTNKECESFRPNFEKFDILSRIMENPTLILSPDLLFKVPPKVAVDMAKRTIKRYFNEEPTMDKYLKSCSDTFYVYPALKLAEKRALQHGAPVFLYQFTYTADFSAIKESKGLKFKGAGHVEDMTFVFRPNSMEGTKGFSPPTPTDQLMAGWMTKFVKNFMYCNDPACNQYPLSMWPPVDKDTLPPNYQEIEMPMFVHFTEIPREQQEMMEFFDSLQNQTS
ncbi:juvenile hormone esterase-like isoform X2 [Maniola hyperantus]|uniref:juvenile hormone esterase-like isoform X2 n=1 Tax=Aphantopus hyperantus TaxID=2795564 RepID=UPI001569BD34|nr:juvenile hormone esterase-like [Maniola hyperantus]